MSYHGSNNTPQNPTPAAGQTQQQTSTPQTPSVGGVISTSLNFPTNPVRGDIITAGDNRWRYNGSVWNRIQPMVQGPEGPEGRQGATGATGATGPVEEFVASLNGFTGDITTNKLIFDFAGISVGASGMTIDGDIIFTGVTGNIKNPSSGGDAKIDLSVGSDEFTLGRFHRESGTSIIGDVDYVSHGTALEVKVKYKTVSVTGGVFFPAQGISLGVGLTFPDGTFQSSAHAPHDFVASFNGATGAIQGVNSFNGLTGAVVTDTLTLPCAGISGPSAITFDNGEVIRNSPDGSIQIIPSDEGGNHFGIEIDATEWGYGPAINVIDESGTQVTKAIRLDTDVVMSNTNVPDGTPARLLFNNASDRGFQQNNNGDGTVMFGVNDNNGHFAVGRKADLSDGDRSMSTSDKTALGMTNPQFLVYSADPSDANDYLRIEHDQTDANLFSGNGKINLNPAGGVVGISGGLEITGSNELKFSGTNVSITAEGSGTNKISLYATDGFEIIKGYTNDFLFDSIYEPSPGTRISTSQVKFTVPLGEFFNISTPTTIKLGDLDAYKSDTQIQISSIQTDGVTGNIFMETNGTVRETFNENYRRNTDVATFTIDASSSIATGTKTNALYRIPYNATLTNFDVKTNATGGLTAAIIISGSDFGSPTTSSITGCSLGVEGLTGSSTVFNRAAVTAGNFIFLHITSNNSGASAAQAFLTYETR